MYDKSEKYQTYSNDLVRNTPETYVRELISLFLEEAAVTMGARMKDDTIERVVYYVLTDFTHMPISLIGSAFARGSLGYLADGRLIPRTIHEWLSQTSTDYMKASAKAKLAEEPESVKMDLKTFPVGKAIIQKADWLSSGAITEEEYDRIPLKELARRIAAGEPVGIGNFI